MVDAVLNVAFYLCIGVVAMITFCCSVYVVVGFIAHAAPRRILGAMGSAVALGAFLAFEIYKFVR